MLRRCFYAQVMLHQDAEASSALMLYRKKPGQIERAQPMFLAAPPAEATTEVHLLTKDLQAVDPDLAAFQ